MKRFRGEISFPTSSKIQVIDITADVSKLCRESGISNGLVVVSSAHTTASIKINERCERLQTDMVKFLEDAIPAKKYMHDERTIDGRMNGRGHLMSMLLNTSETIALKDGHPDLGGWQSIFFVELDGAREERNAIANILGE